MLPDFWCIQLQVLKAFLIKNIKKSPGSPGPGVCLPVIKEIVFTNACNTCGSTGDDNNGVRMNNSDRGNSDDADGGNSRSHSRAVQQLLHADRNSHNDIDDDNNAACSSTVVQMPHRWLLR